jgi:hypothetical protein
MRKVQYIERVTITGPDKDYIRVTDELYKEGYHIMSVLTQRGKKSHFELVAERTIKPIVAEKSAKARREGK